VIEMLLRGFMPRLISLHSQAAWRRWWDGYITTYLERDLRQLSLIKNLPEFRRLMELTSLRTGQLLNKSELARDARLKQPTAHRYLSLLETTKLFEQLPSFSLNRTSRLVKSPKAFWSDPALPVFLSGYYDRSSLEASRELGSFFENLVFHHLRVLASLMTPPARLFYWRTRTDKEVDFVFEHGRKILAIEVKLSAKAGFGDVKNLRFFLEEYPEAVGGLLLYNGREIRRVGEKILAVPWTMVAG
jgi:predicted AAA+ superfamily ATPase